MASSLNHFSSKTNSSSTLPVPGFRFHPTDSELLCFYLKRKICNKPIPQDFITELDIYQHAPWDLALKSTFEGIKYPFLYFFCSKKRKGSSSSKVNRATEFGYWKGTGRDKEIFLDNENGKLQQSRLGWSRIFVFHMGKPKQGAKNERTDWVMHEYELDNYKDSSFVLCKIFKKSSPGPMKHGEFGAPFVEEVWDSDDDHNELASNAIDVPTNEVDKDESYKQITNFSKNFDDNFEDFLEEYINFESDHAP